MSDPNTTRAAESGFTFAITLAEKLATADNFTQLSQAQSGIIDQMRKFDDSMTMDKDWRTWKERAPKAYDDAYQSVLPNVKSNSARQQLQPWFLQQRANGLDKVSQEYNKRLVGEAEGTFAGARARDIKGRDRNSLTQLWDNAEGMGLIDYGRGTKKDQLDADLHQIDYAELEIGALNAWQQHADLGEQYLSDMDNFPGVSVDERERIRSHVNAIINGQAATANNQAKAQNGALEAKINDFEKKGDYAGAQNYLNSITFQSTVGPQGEDGAKMWQYWSNELATGARRKLEGPPHPKFETPEWKALMSDASRSGADPGPILAKAREYARRGVFDWTGEYSEKTLEDILDKKVTDKAAPYLEEFKMPQIQAKNLSDAKQIAGVEQALGYQGARFKQWVSVHPDATDADMEKEAKRRHTLAMQGVVEDAVKDIYSAANIPTYPGTVPAMIPAGGHPAPKTAPPAPAIPKSAAEADAFVQQHKGLPKLPAGGKVVSGFKRGGVTYVLSTDGKWYTQ